MAVASLGKIADKLKVVNLTDKMDLEEHKVIIPDEVQITKLPANTSAERIL